MKALGLLLLRWLQKRCDHPDYAVKADILEGVLADGGVQWCDICGSHRLTYLGGEGLWRRPRPDWYTPKERKQLARDHRAAVEREERNLESYH